MLDLRSCHVGGRPARCHTRLGLEAAPGRVGVILAALGLVLVPTSHTAAAQAGTEAGRPGLQGQAPIALAAFRITPDSARLGGQVQGTVRLSAAAPAGGVTIRLWPNTVYGAPASLNMPLDVHVPAGRSVAVFPVTVTGVPGPVQLHPSAELGSTLLSTKLLVVPTTFAVAAGGVLRGRTTWRAVGLGVRAGGGGAEVRLRSTIPGVTAPASVRVPAGARGVT